MISASMGLSWNPLWFLYIENTALVEGISRLDNPDLCHVEKAMLQLDGDGTRKSYSGVELKFPDAKVPLPALGYGCETGGPVVSYLRNETEIQERQAKQTSCKPVLDVLAWTMDMINCRNETLMVTYGSLIHMLRDGDFASSNGTFLDDDFDMFSSSGGVEILVHLESLLWDRFGWTLRFFHNCQLETIFGQIFPACGHNISHDVSKIWESIAIELYILHGPYNDTEAGGISSYWDSWGGTRIASKDLFPVNHVNFETRAANHSLSLQIPADPDVLLTCIYGNWRLPSTDKGPNDALCLPAHINVSNLSSNG